MFIPGTALYFTCIFHGTGEASRIEHEFLPLLEKPSNSESHTKAQAAEYHKFASWGHLEQATPLFFREVSTREVEQDTPPYRQQTAVAMVTPVFYKPLSAFGT